MGTEEPNPATANLDQLSTLDVVRAINAEDQTVARAVAQAMEPIATAVDRITDRLRTGGRLFYVGTGTSGRMGVLDAVECPPTYGVPRDMVQGIIAGGYPACYGAAEAAEDDEDQAVTDVKERGITARDAVVGIAASGRTPYTISAVRFARRLGALTVGISCNTGSALAAAADVGIEVNTGPEVVAGSTRMKAGTAQKMILNIISTAVMVRLGHVYGNLMINVQLMNQKLVLRGQRIVGMITGASEDEVKRALEQTGSVRAAVIQIKRGCSADEAKALAMSNRNLREIIAAKE